MKLSKSNKKRILAVIGFLLVLLILKIILTLTAKPKITVDYVAEYNRITLPANYDPNENAAPYYQKAFDAFVEMPDELQKQHYINWPEDFNSAEQTIFKAWLTLNSRAFEYFKIAANKPYYWLKRYADKDNDMMSMTFPESSSLHHLTDALLWNAKLEASKGRLQTAFENIIDCYRSAHQKCKTISCLMEQRMGLNRKKTVLDSALIILDKTSIDSPTLKSFQNALQVEFDNDDYIPSIQTEKYFLYDAVQHRFIDNGRGTGRLAFSVGFKYITLGDTWSNLKQGLYHCLAGPTRNEILEQIERLIVASDQIMTKTPWQIKNESGDYLKEMRDIKGSTESIFHSYHKTRTQTEALIAILAILRFKTDNHQLPASLDELISTGYLQSVPMDPYSNGPLVYKHSEDNFTLYSVGENFSDENGVFEIRTRHDPEFRGKYTDTYLYKPDIVYWPIKELKRPHREIAVEETKKEEGTQGKIEEAK